MHGDGVELRVHAIPWTLGQNALRPSASLHVLPKEPRMSFRATAHECEHCKREYLQVRKWQRFCTSACRDRWHNESKAKRIEELEALLAKVEERT